jgi:hypothetical protein
MVPNVTQVGGAELDIFVGQMPAYLGGAASTALVRIGAALGLYKALHASGPFRIILKAKPLRP